MASSSYTVGWKEAPGLRVLVITQLFPSSSNPWFAPFNRQQFAALGRELEVEVLALVPWHPGRSWAGRLLGTPRPPLPPRQENIDGLRVYHPVVFYLPKLGQTFSGWTFAASLLGPALRYRGRVDAVLGAFAYPDGWAAVEVGRWLGVPVVIKVHGSDLNVLAKRPHLESKIRRVLMRAAAVVAPSQALVTRAFELGARAPRLVPNGVARELFYVRDRAECRHELGRPPERRILLYVGNLLRTKGVFELLDAFRQLVPDHPDLDLVMVGGGADRRGCVAYAEQHRLPVHFAGECPPEQVARWMGAAELVTLPSWAEGTPNVVLEALASGRRVVASRVGGIPAIVDRPLLGELVPPQDSVALAEALARALRACYEPEAVSEALCVGDWTESARLLKDVIGEAVERFRNAGGNLSAPGRSRLEP